MKFDVVVSLRGRDLGEMLAKANGLTGNLMLEFRLDSYMRGTDKNPVSLTLPPDLLGRSIITYRNPAEGGLDMDYDVGRALNIIKWFTLNPPAFLDIEAAVALNKEISSALGTYSGRVIISNHLTDGGGSLKQLLEFWNRWNRSAYYVKIVTRPADVHESLLALELYGMVDSSRLISFSIGKRWSFTRFTSVLLGSPILYSCLPDEPLADGQPTVLQAVKFREAMEYGA